MRVLSLHLPHWSAQRLRAAASVDDGRPVVVHHPVHNLPRVAALTAAAARHGVAVGMPLAEAEALLPADALRLPLDAAGDLAELRRLAVLCGRFGPASGIEEGDRPESLLVDVTGCGPFFGGERGLAEQAIALLDERRYAARAGLADTVGLAWAASRVVGQRIVIVSAGDGEAWLSRRPTAALRLDPKTLATLDGLGLRTVGDVLRLPRAELPSRFGPRLLQRIGQALGTIPEAVEPIRPPVPLAVRWSGETPLTDRPSIAAVLTRLVGRLVSRLPAWEGVTALSCGFDDRPPLVVRSASPARSAERLASLVALALDREPPPREVGSVVVTAETVRLPPPDRTDLFGGRTDAERERLFARLVERLAGRLGEDAVTRPALVGEHLPERSVEALPLPAPAPPPQRARNVTALGTRPILLLPVPEPVEVVAVYPDGPPHRLTRRGRTNPLVSAIGPERIEAGWEDAPEARRDYWRVETDDAERLWLFRCRRSGRWFLHGLFG
jgi:protein ImuB